MSTAPYDVAVIGGGPGGYVAAIRAAQLGLKVVCIERRKELGGTCLNEGCIPSKALLQSTEHYAFLARHGKQHGIEIKGLSCNFEQMMRRKSEVVKSLVEGINGLFKKNRISRIEGTARLISPNQIKVTSGDNSQQTIEAKNVIIATGSEPIALPGMPFDAKNIVSSTEALSLPQMPKRMLVVGAGVVGVELASVYNRLGTDVTIVEMLPEICPAMDSAISKALLQALTKQGIAFHLSTQVKGAKLGKDNITVSIQETAPLTLTVDVVLVSVGRKPFTAGLGLEELGITMTPKGFIAVDGSFRTSSQNIFAIGDAIEGVMLAHRASDEGVAVAEIISGGHPHINYMAIPNVIYTHPEAAAVGMTEKEARESGLDIKVGTFPFKGNARARAGGDDEGLVKIIGEAKTGRLVGLHIIGPNASEMIGEGVIAMEKKATITEIANATHAHPTCSEAIKEAALNALGRTIHL